MLLDSINSPEDVKKLDFNDLEPLAKEIRQRIIDVVSEKGGHFATPLGVVELTIALHRVFDSPKDKLIWDVGHQIYAHKLITGRKDRFHTLRQYNGVSGFPCRDESEHDHFATGHASTSVSAALGMAVARDYNKEDYKVVGIIGDGGLTGGVAYEGLDHAGHLKKDMLIILNDNDMSISPPVGAISHSLNQVITSHYYNKTKEGVDRILGKTIGNALMKRLQKVEESIKSLIVPGVFFEELGFRYFGPINGHDLKELTETLENIKGLSGPIFLHIVTEKGHGYEYAVEDPSTWHGAKPFDKVTGRFKAKKADTPQPPAYTTVFGKTVCKMVESNPNVVGITAAMASGTGLSILQKEHPDNFIDVGIAEQHGVLFSAGLACEKVRPVCAIYATFLQRGFDQIFHDVCVQRLPVIFALDRAGVVGDDGKQFQGLYDIGYLRVLPNMIVSAPANEKELAQLLWTALEYDKGPFAIRYPRDVGVGVDWSVEKSVLPIGKGEVVQEGSEVAILAFGTMVQPAIDAAAELRQQGLKPTVVNARFAKPLDTELIRELAEKHHYFVTYEDHSIIGGFSSAVSEAMHDMNIDIPLLRLALPDQVIPHGKRSQIFEEHFLLPHQAAKRIHAFAQTKVHELAAV